MPCNTLSISLMIDLQKKLWKLLIRFRLLLRWIQKHYLKLVTIVYSLMKKTRKDKTSSWYFKNQAQSLLDKNTKIQQNLINQIVLAQLASLNLLIHHKLVVIKNS